MADYEITFRKVIKNVDDEGQAIEWLLEYLCECVRDCDVTEYEFKELVTDDKATEIFSSLEEYTKKLKRMICNNKLPH